MSENVNKVVELIRNGKIFRTEQIISILSVEEKESLMRTLTDYEKYTLFLFKMLPKEEMIRFMQFFKEEDTIVDALLLLPREAIINNPQFIYLIEKFLSKEYQTMTVKDGTPDTTIIRAIVRLPLEKLKSDYLSLLEPYIKKNIESLKFSEDTAVVEAILMLSSEKKCKYLKSLISNGSITDNIQKELLTWNDLEEIVKNEIETNANDNFFDNLCIEFQERYINYLIETKSDTTNDENIIISRITALKDETIIQKYIKRFNRPYSKITVIASLSPDVQKKYINVIDDSLKQIDCEADKCNAVCYLTNEIKILYIDQFKDFVYKEQILNNLTDDEKAKYLISHKEELDGKDIYKIIGTVKSEDILKELLFEKRIISREFLKKYRSNSSRRDFIVENIEEFIKNEIPGIEDDDLEYRKKMIYEISKRNSDVWNKIDMNILNQKIVQKVGIYKLTTIATFSHIQEQILNMSDKELDIWIRCIDNYMEDIVSGEWNIIGMELLKNITNGEYDDLINSIEDIEELSGEDVDIISKILQTANVFEIKNIEECRRYKEIKDKKCAELISSDDIEKKKLAVLEKVFGQDIEFSKRIVNGFKDIEELQDGDIKNYLLSINEIMKINEPEILEKIYEQCKEVTFISKEFLLHEIKKEYAKEFNKDLFRIEEATKVDGEENIYEAGTDFRMIVHVVSPFVHDVYLEENHQKRWNRKDMSSQFLCASYIRNDMLGTAGAHVGKLTYGFYSMDEESLIGSYYSDAGTSGVGISSYMYNEYFLSPENQINRSGENSFCGVYNEMNYSRTQNGEKKQPDYILVFKQINGEILGLPEAKEAQKDWGGTLPIVIVDVKKCVIAEKAKVESMKQEYERTHSPIIARSIYNKIKNNMKTLEQFKGDIEFYTKEELELYKVSDEEIEQYMDEHKEEIGISLSELKENYESCSAVERQETIGKMKKIFRQIIQIEQGDVEIGE